MCRSVLEIFYLSEDDTFDFSWELCPGQVAQFDDTNLVFDLGDPPATGIAPGRYHLISKSRHTGDISGAEEPAADYGNFLYRLSHPLGEYVIDSAKAMDTPPTQVVFDVSHHPARLHLIEALRGKRGYLALTKLAIESYEREEYLLFSAFDEEGRALDQETCEKLFNCSGRIDPGGAIPESATQRLAAESERHAKAAISRSLEQNSQHFNQAREKLEKWADDMVLAAEKALRRRFFMMWFHHPASFVESSRPGLRQIAMATAHCVPAHPIAARSRMHHPHRIPYPVDFPHHGQ